MAEDSMVFAYEVWQSSYFLLATKHTKGTKKDCKEKIKNREQKVVSALT